MKTIHTFIRVVIVITTFGTITASHAAPRYQIIDLGSLGGSHYYETFSGITGKLLNEHGVVSAGMETAKTDPLCLNGGACLALHGFLWNDGTLSDLGLLVSGDQSDFSQSFSINDQNNCAGISTYNVRGPSSEPLYRAVMWNTTNGNRQMIDLGTLGGNQSLAHAINNRDQIVGWALNQTPETTNIWEFYPFPFGTQQRAVLWENGTNLDLGTLGGSSAWASHINDQGQIIGQSFTSTGSSGQHTITDLDITWSRPIAGFLWQNGQMIDLGNSGGTFVLPTRINNKGQIIGLMTIPGDSTYHPFLWTNGVLKDLGTFGGASGQANDINELGEVVGGTKMATGARRAFLWRNGVLKNLGTIGFHSQAWGINAKSQVIGTSGANPGDYRAFLWEDNGNPMLDLNSLVPAGSPRLAYGIDINDRGEILVGGLNEQSLYLLIPLPTLSIRTSETPTGRKIVVEGKTIPGRRYRLENSSDLKTWSTVGALMVADQETTTWELQTGSGSVFFRIAGPL
jgi:probable HAF family extracellular repeat protein